MYETQVHLIALVEGDADAARKHAKRLRLLAEYVVGNKEEVLRQAASEDESAESYENIARNMRKDWKL